MNHFLKVFLFKGATQTILDKVVISYDKETPSAADSSMRHDVLDLGRLTPVRKGTLYWGKAFSGMSAPLCFWCFHHMEM